MLMKELLLPFATGLTIFMFGMQCMRIGFENLLLHKIKELLLQLTSRPWLGLCTGTLATAALQSSSAVMLITIGLTHAKILTFNQAVGIILGANIGTVLTIELLAFPLSEWTIYVGMLGLICMLIPQTNIRSSGFIMLGFGMLFAGMQTMQAITPALKTLGWVDTLFIFSSEGLFSGVLAGTLLTAFIQSSTAVSVMTMNLFHDQLIPLSTAIALALGSNIGTCVTALLASIGTNLAARQVAIAHTLLNVIGVLVFIPFIPILMSVVESLTVLPKQQVAHAQLIFNIACSLCVLPFVHYFVKLIQAIVSRP